MKEKFIHAHMKTAEVYADLSSARRLHVGCVIVKNDTIIGIGYNGMPTGWDNNCEEEISWPTGEIQFLKSKPEVLHAETNAIAKVANEFVKKHHYSGKVVNNSSLHFGCFLD